MRYWTYTMLAALAGGFVAAETHIFSAATASLLSFAVGIATAVVAIGALGQALSKGSAYVAIAALTAVLGGWLVVESLVFVDATAKWLSFATGAGVLGLSLVGLTLHEHSTERVVHALDVERPVREREPVIG